MSSPLYKRILFKISGEVLGGKEGWGVGMEVFRSISSEVAEIHNIGVQVAIVVGGGNIFRGNLAESVGMDRATADYIGMLSTVMNALILQDFLERINVPCRVLSAIEIKELCEPYIRRKAIRHIEKGRVVILGGGTGNPFFSTDTAASLRAIELKAEAILKATKVDGIYDADPILNKNAVKFDEISYIDIINRGLSVMDTTAVTLCMEKRLPIIVFNVTIPGNMKRILLGEKLGTLVRDTA